MQRKDKNAVIYGGGGALPSWRAAAGDTAGRACFEVGGRPVEAVGGDVLVVAPGTAHTRSAPSVRSAC